MNAKLDARGLNKDLTTVVLDESKMRELGFTDYAKETWYYCATIGQGVTFNLSIPKEGGGRPRIDVLDEDFGQPYDYQRILNGNPSLDFALRVKSNVENLMTKFSEEGIIKGFTVGMYI